MLSTCHLARACRREPGDIQGQLPSEAVELDRRAPGHWCSYKQNPLTRPGKSTRAVSPQIQDSVAAASLLGTSLGPGSCRMKANLAPWLEDSAICPMLHFLWHWSPGGHKEHVQDHRAMKVQLEAKGKGTSLLACLSFVFNCCSGRTKGCPEKN
jgi:hypothetical protein